MPIFLDLIERLSICNIIDIMIVIINIIIAVIIIKINPPFSLSKL